VCGLKVFSSLFFPPPQVSGISSGQKKRQLHNSKTDQNRNFTFDWVTQFHWPTMKKWYIIFAYASNSSCQLGGGSLCFWIPRFFFRFFLLWLISRLPSAAAPQIFRILQMHFAFSIAQTCGGCIHIHKTPRIIKQLAGKMINPEFRDPAESCLSGSGCNSSPYNAILAPIPNPKSNSPSPRQLASHRKLVFIVFVGQHTY